MSSFTRFAGVAVVVLSLGFLVTALPAARGTIPAITGTDAVSLVCAELAVKIEACLKAFLGCNTLAELQVQVGICVALFKACADELLKIGAGVTLEVGAKANIVACFAALITLLVKVCVQVSVKFGLAVVLELYAQIDVALRLCLFNLNICVDGILVLIAKAIASVTVGLLAQVHLKLCLEVLGLKL